MMPTGFRCPTCFDDRIQADGSAQKLTCVHGHAFGWDTILTKDNPDAQKEALVPVPLAPKSQLEMLTVIQAGLLLKTTYAGKVITTPAYRIAANALVEDGLFERDSTSALNFRRTEEGDRLILWALRDQGH